MNKDLFDIPSSDSENDNILLDAETETSYRIPTPPPKKERKKRKPMSEEQREKMLERLRIGRETAKRNRLERRKQLNEERSETLKTLKELKEQVKNDGYKSINDNSIYKVNNDKPKPKPDIEKIPEPKAQPKPVIKVSPFKSRGQKQKKDFYNF